MRSSPLDGNIDRKIGGNSHLSEVIVTASSEAYSRQLLALLGSLRCNWPGHPQAIVYDLGLGAQTRDTLDKAGVMVIDVPPFVAHWRKHYTWKLWCLANAPGDRVLWLDAGCCVLRPLPEVFAIIQAQGYFSVPNYQPLAVEASSEACEGCGVDPDFRIGKPSLAANVFGFARGTEADKVVAQCLQVALVERHIRATHPKHRHDQAILSLLMHRRFQPLILCDGTMYASEDLHANFTTHGIWAMRRGMHYRDIAFYADALAGSPSPHRPRPSHKLSRWYKTAWQAKLMLDRIKSLGRASAMAPDGVRH